MYLMSVIMLVLLILFELIISDEWTMIISAMIGITIGIFARRKKTNRTNKIKIISKIVTINEHKEIEIGENKIIGINNIKFIVTPMMIFMIIYLIWVMIEMLSKGIEFIVLLFLIDFIIFFGWILIYSTKTKIIEFFPGKIYIAYYFLSIRYSWNLFHPEHVKHIYINKRIPNYDENCLGKSNSISNIILNLKSENRISLIGFNHDHFKGFQLNKIEQHLTVMKGLEGLIEERVHR